MGVEKTYDVRWLRGRPAMGGYSADKVDAELGIIRDVVMVQEGEAKGHGVHLEAEFIDDIVTFDVAHFSKQGLKARFGHPSASNETMGTQLGIFKNFRKRVTDGVSEEIADLHLLESANESPTHPGMRSWMLKMAQERPDFLMSSIVFNGKGYYQRKPNGHKHALIINTEFYGEPFTNYKEEWGNIFIEFGEHLDTDIVEQGAATDSLFSNKVNPHLFVAQADSFLEEHPQITQFIKANPEKVVAFFSSIGIKLKNEPSDMAKFNILKWLSGEPQEDPQAEDLETVRTALTDARTEMTTLKDQKEAAENRAKELSDQVDTLTKSLRDSNEEVKGINTQLAEAQKEIEELKKDPADEHTGGPTDSGGKKLSKTPKTDALLAKYGIE